jgi:hypothetical protein
MERAWWWLPEPFGRLLFQAEGFQSLGLISNRLVGGFTLRGGVRAFRVSGHLIKGFVGTHLQIICTHVHGNAQCIPTFHGAARR